VFFSLAADHVRAVNTCLSQGVHPHQMIFTALLAAFILMPLAELAVLFKVHGALGLGKTLGIVIFTGFFGAVLARVQGLMVIQAIRRDLAEGRMPAPRLMDGVMILIAGVLLITPGLITDATGFVLLIPAVRRAIRTWLRTRLEQKLQEGHVTTWRW